MGGTMANQGEDDLIKGEFINLYHYIQRVRQEIAAISDPIQQEHHFDSMAEQLDAIVDATEDATNTIMDKVEENGALLDQFRSTLDEDTPGSEILDQIQANSSAIFETCSFQDITGQRINKVVKSLQYVEERVNTIVEIWDEEDLKSVSPNPAAQKSDDEKLLNGPQLKGRGMDQSAIDALFD